MVPKGPKAAFSSFVFAIIGLAGCGTSSVQGTSSVAPTGYLAANTKLWTKSIAASSVPPAIPNQSNPPQDVVSAIAGLKTGGFATAGYTLGAYPGFTNPMQIAQAVAARYDAQGNQLWLMQLSSGMGDLLEAATTDTAGNIYCGGAGGLSDPIERGARAAFHADVRGRRARVQLLQDRDQKGLNRPHRAGAAGPGRDPARPPLARQARRRA